jgi:hypothetical protein
MLRVRFARAGRRISRTMARTEVITVERRGRCSTSQPDITLDKLRGRLVGEGIIGDGRICLTNNAAERALRGIAIGPGSRTFFAGSPDRQSPGYLIPPYSPDLNPIEQRQTQGALAQSSRSTVDALWSAIGNALHGFSPAECASYFLAVWLCSS